MVFIPIILSFSARFITSFISLIPLVTALKSINDARVVFAIILASVVFPTPGGPQNIMELIMSLSRICRSTFPVPTKCS